MAGPQARTSSPPPPCGDETGLCLCFSWPLTRGRVRDCSSFQVPTTSPFAPSTSTSSVPSPQLLLLGLNTEGTMKQAENFGVQPSSREVRLGSRSRREQRGKGVFREEGGVEMTGLERGTDNRGYGRQGDKARLMSPSGSMVTWSSRSVCPPLFR